MSVYNEGIMASAQVRIADALERIADALEADRVTEVNRRDFPEAVEVTSIRVKS